MNAKTGTIDQESLHILRWNLDSLSTRPMDVYPPRDIVQLIRDEDDLPVLPETGRRLLQLLDQPDADVGDLAGIVERDPLLAAQLIRWSNSAYYCLRQPVTSLKEAISRVLGFEQTLHLALGLIALSPLETPDSGVIGRKAVARHAVQCSRLLAKLRDLLPTERRPSAGQLQLSGLTQNIGYLLLGHLLPAAFAFLENVLSKNPRIQLSVAEHFTLGVDHGQLGFWLLEHWGMPLPVQAAVRHHHNPNYDGPQRELVLLNGLADSLLSLTNVGLGPAIEEPQLEALSEQLGLAPADCRVALTDTLGKT